MSDHTVVSITAAIDSKIAAVRAKIASHNEMYRTLSSVYMEAGMRVGWEKQNEIYQTELRTLLDLWYELQKPHSPSSSTASTTSQTG